MSRLPPDSDEVAVLVATDPAPEVRIAAAKVCGVLSVLVNARENESDNTVRTAITAALATLLSESPDNAGAATLLGSAQCGDAMRADVARRANDVERRRHAIAAIQDEAVLVDLALTAEHANTRMAAAEHVRTPDGLRQLADAAKDKDRGVARLARKQLGMMEHHEDDTLEADATLTRLEALASEPGPILTSVIELNRRWQALELRDDPPRIARYDAAWLALRTRFDREHAGQQARMQFERKLSEWLGRMDAPETSAECDVRRGEIEALRAEGRDHLDSSLKLRLDEAAHRVEQWAQDIHARAGAEALVIEAEQLALAAPIDDANLPERWQALNKSIRTPALTQRFEAALAVIRQGRLAETRAVEQRAHSSRQHLHMLLHSAELALVAGQMQTARDAADEIRTRRPDAGILPKPTLQRLSRVMQQLKALEGWESFGQHQAIMQLCERAEAAITLKVDARNLSVEVQKLRNEWSTLERQQGAAPKPLSERFDRACTRAYAPAARYFAEQAELQKQVRKQREAFITAAAAQVPTLLTEPRDWRAIERWLRETDRRWRDAALGSMNPKAWKSLDAGLTAALAPLRDALFAARGEAKTRRVALIAEAIALQPKAVERDALAQIKDMQARWQAQANQPVLTQRDERALWEQFRAACDAVFRAREAKRHEADALNREKRAVLESLCVQLEQLASATDKQEQEKRREMRELQEQWTRSVRTSDPASRGLESRFANAKMSIESAISAQARARKMDVWRTLATKEHLCEELDRRLCSGEGNTDALHAQWAALTALPTAWENALVGRRDATLLAIADETLAPARVTQILSSAGARDEILLELELLLGLESPPELQAERRMLQLKRLRDRFQGNATSGTATAGERLLAWCAHPGIANTDNRRRCERVFSAMET